MKRHGGCVYDNVPDSTSHSPTFVSVLDSFPLSAPCMSVTVLMKDPSLSPEWQCRLPPPPQVLYAALSRQARAGSCLNAGGECKVDEAETLGKQ